MRTLTEYVKTIYIYIWGSSYPSADRLYVNKYKIILVARVIFCQHFQ